MLLLTQDVVRIACPSHKHAGGGVEHGRYQAIQGRTFGWQVSWMQWVRPVDRSPIPFHLTSHARYTTLMLSV